MKAMLSTAVLLAAVLTGFSIAAKEKVSPAQESERPVVSCSCKACKTKGKCTCPGTCKCAGASACECKKARPCRCAGACTCERSGATAGSCHERAGSFGTVPKAGASCGCERHAAAVKK
jgi:hypothetical protein